MHKSNQCSVKQALIKLIVPITIAAVTAFLCQPLYMAGGKCDYCISALLIGIFVFAYRIISGILLLTTAVTRLLIRK